MVNYKSDLGFGDFLGFSISLFILFIYKGSRFSLAAGSYQLVPTSPPKALCGRARLPRLLCASVGCLGAAGLLELRSRPVSSPSHPRMRQPHSSHQGMGSPQLHPGTPLRVWPSRTQPGLKLLGSSTCSCIL